MESEPEGVVVTLSRLEEFRQKLPEWYAQKAKELDIKILPPPIIDSKLLLKMSIERTAPFEESEKDESEKGFRDSLIMFGILEEIRNESGTSALVITGDKLLTKGLQNYAPEFNAKVSVVASLDEAKEYIDKRVTQVVRDYLAKQSEIAKEMLEQYRSQIAEELSGIHELTETDLRISPIFGALSGTRPLDVGESVEKVNSLNLSNRQQKAPICRMNDAVLYRASAALPMRLGIFRSNDWKAVPTARS